MTYETTHDKRHLVVKMVLESEFTEPLQFQESFMSNSISKKCFVGGYPESDMKAAIHMRMCHLFSPKIQMTRGT